MEEFKNTKFGILASTDMTAYRHVEIVGPPSDRFDFCEAAIHTASMLSTSGGLLVVGDGPKKTASNLSVDDYLQYSRDYAPLVPIIEPTFMPTGMIRKYHKPNSGFTIGSYKSKRKNKK